VRLHTTAATALRDAAIRGLTRYPLTVWALCTCTPLRRSHPACCRRPGRHPAFPDCLLIAHPYTTAPPFRSLHSSSSSPSRSFQVKRDASACIRRHQAFSLAPVGPPVKQGMGTSVRPWVEEKMLLNLNKNKWSEGLRLEAFDKHADANEKASHKTPPTTHPREPNHVNLST